MANQTSNLNFKVNAQSNNFNKTLETTKKNVSNLGRSVNKTASGYGNWFKQNKKLGESFANINKDVNRASAGMGSFGKALNFGVAVMAVRTLMNAIGMFTTASMDSIETQNLFNVSMGETVDQATEVVDSLTKVYGLDPTNLKSSIGTFALLAKSMGMSSDQAEILSTQTAQMAIDLSSLMNVPITQVMGDLKSGLIGQSETVYKYGMDVTEAGIKQEAMAEGITKSVRNMNQGEKMALRYNVMVKTISRNIGDGVSVMGDFARTIDQPANQMKILTDRFTTLTRSIGNIFMPMLEKVLPYLNAMVIILIEASNALATFFGYIDPNTKPKNALSGVSEDAKDTTDSVDDTTDAVKKLNKSIIGIDELNVMTAPKEETGVGSGGNILESMDMANVYKMLGDIPSKAKEIAEQINGYFKSIGDSDTFINLSKIFNKLSEINIKPLIKSLGDLYNSLKPIVKNLFDGLIFLMDKILVPLSTFFIEEIIPRYITAIGTAVKFAGDVISNTGEIFAQFIDYFLIPLSEFTAPLVLAFFDNFNKKISDFQEKFAETTAFEDLKTILKAIYDVLIPILKPILEFNIGVAEFVMNNAFIVFSALLTDLEDKFGLIVDLLNGDFTGAMEHLKDLVIDNNLDILKDAFENVKKSASDTMVKLKETFTKENMENAFKNIGVAIGQAFDFATKVAVKLNDWAIAITPYFTKEKWNEIFKGIGLSIIETMKDVFSWFAEGKWKELGKNMYNGLTGGINSIIDSFQSLLNGTIGLINKIIEGYNTIAKTNPLMSEIQVVKSADLSKFKIPKLALGGIVEHSTVAEIGEAGTEAVVPLRPDKLMKYFEPILGTINNEDKDSYETTYRAMKDALKDSSDESESTFNFYFEGGQETSISGIKRKNMRSGKIIIPVGG